MHVISVILRAIDWFNNCVRFYYIILLCLVGVVVYGVGARYLFGNPTVWDFETSIFIYGACLVLPMGYTLYHKGHVRVEIFSQRLPPRGQAILMSINYVVFALPIIMVIILTGPDFVGASWALRETTTSPWAPPIYPLKATLPVGAFLLLLQVLADLSRQIIFAVKGVTV